MEIPIRRCLTCKSTFLDDVDICPHCAQVTQTQRQEIPGIGKIYSFTRVHVSHDQFKNSVPYYLAIIQLDAGPRLMARLKTEEGDNVRVDAPVELVGSDQGFIFAMK